MNVVVRVDIAPEHLEKRRAMTDLTQIDHPIKVIRQNTSVAFNMGVGFEIAGDDPIPPFDVEISYEDIEGVEYSSIQSIDVRELSRRPANRPPVTVIKVSIEEIAKSLKATQRSLERLEKNIPTVPAPRGSASAN
ncbi:MAG: hypothetical protein U1E40_02010 [Amaricoccus sp.]